MVVVTTRLVWLAVPYIVCTRCTWITIFTYFVSTDKSDVVAVLQFYCPLVSPRDRKNKDAIPAVKTTVETFLTTGTEFGACLSKVWGARGWCWPTDTGPECWHRCMEYVWCRCLWCWWINIGLREWQRISCIAMCVAKLGMGGWHIINCPFAQAVWRSVDEVTGCISCLCQWLVSKPLIF